MKQEYLCLLMSLFILEIFFGLVWPCYSAVIACSVFLRFLMLYAFTSSCCPLAFMLLAFIFGPSFSIISFKYSAVFSFLFFGISFVLHSCVGLLIKLRGLFLLKQDYLCLLVTMLILEIFWGLVWPCYSAVITCSVFLRFRMLYAFTSRCCSLAFMLLGFIYGPSFYITFVLYNAVFFSLRKIFFF